MNRETVGKISSDLIIKAPETTSPIEQMRESLSEYDKNVWECIESGKRKFSGDFYVVVITKNERLMPNVFRNFFLSRLSCPTPEWDQTVYKYKRKTDQVIFMWVIPSKDACIHLTNNRDLVAKEEQQLLQYVLSFNDGTLMKLAKDLNNEKKENAELRGFEWKGKI